MRFLWIFQVLNIENWLILSYIMNLSVEISFLFLVKSQNIPEKVRFPYIISLMHMWSIYVCCLFPSIFEGSNKSFCDYLWFLWWWIFTFHVPHACFECEDTRLFGKHDSRKLKLYVWKLADTIRNYNRHHLDSSSWFQTD